MIKEHHNNSDERWIDLIELTAGWLLNYKDKIITILGEEIYNLFSELVDKRNSIIHSIPTGEKVDNYVIPVYRNDSKHKYVRINKKYLIDFIKKNEKLSSLIHSFRGY